MTSAAIGTHGRPTRRATRFILALFPALFCRLLACRMSRRLFLSLWCYHFLCLLKMVSERLGMEFLHHTTFQILVKCAAQMVLKTVTWPQDWPPLRPLSWIEWFIELTFAFKREAHPTGNFAVSERPTLCLKFHAAQLKALRVGLFRNDNENRVGPGERVEPNVDRLNEIALTCAVHLVCLCCPTTLPLVPETKRQLTTDYLDWVQGLLATFSDEDLKEGSEKGSDEEANDDAGKAEEAEGQEVGRRHIS